MAQDVTNVAQEGFTWTDRSKGNPYLRTSTYWEAWQIGRWLDSTGRLSPEPKSVRTSRGSTYHVRDMKVRVHATGEVTRIS